MQNTIKLIIAVSIPLLTGFTSGFFTITGSGSWYQTIQRPEWNPPNWVFGPVWTTLYVLMGIALFLIWKADVNKQLKKLSVFLFAVQLVFNFFWSIIFFRLQQPGWAFAEIVILWSLIFATIIYFSKINKSAAWLLVPYISWVSFAAILNYSIWKLNS